jgi:hypothetical protein
MIASIGIPVMSIIIVIMSYQITNNAFGLISDNNMSDFTLDDEIIVGDILAVGSSVDDQNNQSRLAETGIKTGRNSTAIAVNPNTDMVYVTSKDSDTVSNIEGKTNKIVHNITGISRPSFIDVNPRTNTIYVASENANANILYVINGTNKSVSNITLGSLPSAVAVNPATNRIYVVIPDRTSHAIDLASNKVTVIDGNTSKAVANITPISADHLM